MSTISSLKCERNEATGEMVHLYREGFDDAHVYLEVEGFHFEAESSCELSGKGAMSVTIRLPNEWARKLGLLESASPRPTMTELLAKSDYSQPQGAEEREWVDAPPAGGELV
jgi:hypothetical protein